MIKRIFALLLALLLCAMLVACKDEGGTSDPPPPAGPNEGDDGGGTTPPAPTVAFAGRVGESFVMWRMMTSGELIIGGTGDMPDFATVSEGNDSRPWAELIPYITTVTVESGVTSLGEHVFKNLNKLKTVTLSAGITALPYAAFENCTALESVSGGVGLAEIDENAFLNCSSLATVSISTPLAHVGYGAFSTGSSRTLTLHFTGSETEWQTTLAAMTVEGGNDAFANATVTCFPRS